MSNLTHIDLFSGIGGFTLAAEAAGFQTILFCEYDEHRQRDLAHHWPNIPIVKDVNDIEAISRIVADTQQQRDSGESKEMGREEHEKTSGESESRGTARASINESPETLRTVAKPISAQANEKQHEPEAHEGERRPDLHSRCLLTAGVPCQPASSAGKRKASADDRWLWPATLRVVERLKPTWCVFENPLGIASLAEPAAIPGVELKRLCGMPGRTLAEILRAIRSLGYELPCDWDGVPWIPVVPAAGVGAFHGRDRLWIIARRIVGDAQSGRGEGMRADGREGVGIPAGEGIFGRPCGDVEHAEERTIGSGLCETTEQKGDAQFGCGRHGDTSGKTLPDWSGAVIERGADGVWRAVKPGLRMLVNGVPRRVAKLRGFGNAIVPQVAVEILKAIRNQIFAQPACAGTGHENPAAGDRPPGTL